MEAARILLDALRTRRPPSKALTVLSLVLCFAISVCPAASCDARSATVPLFSQVASQQASADVQPATIGDLVRQLASASQGRRSTAYDSLKREISQAIEDVQLRDAKPSTVSNLIGAIVAAVGPEPKGRSGVLNLLLEYSSSGYVEIASEPCRALIVASVDDGDRNINVPAKRLLFEFPVADLVARIPTIAQVLRDDPDSDLRLSAISALFRTVRPLEHNPEVVAEVVPVVTLALIDKDSRVRQEATWHMRFQRSALTKPVVSSLESDLRDRDASVQLAAANALCGVGYEDQVQDAIPTVVAMLSGTTEQSHTACSILRAAYRIAGEAVPGIRAALANANPQKDLERYADVLDSFAVVGGLEGAKPRLLALLEGDSHQKYAAINILFRYQSADWAAPGVFAALDKASAEHNIPTSQAAMRWLAIAGKGEELMPRLLSWLDGDRDRKMLSLSTLGGLGSIAGPSVPKVVSILHEANNSADLDLLYATISCLGNLGRVAEAAVPNLVELCAEDRFGYNEARVVLPNMGPQAVVALPTLAGMLVGGDKIIAGSAKGEWSKRDAENMRSAYLTAIVRVASTVRNHASANLDPALKALAEESCKKALAVLKPQRTENRMVGSARENIASLAEFIGG